MHWIGWERVVFVGQKSLHTDYPFVEVSHSTILYTTQPRLYRPDLFVAATCECYPCVPVAIQSFLLDVHISCVWSPRPMVTFNSRLCIM